MKEKIRLKKIVNHYSGLIIAMTAVFMISYSCNRVSIIKDSFHQLNSNTTLSAYLKCKDSVISLMLKDSALLFLKENLNQAKLSNRSQDELFALSGLGSYFFQNHNFDSAHFFYNKALKMAFEIKDPYSLPYLLIEIADIHYNVDNYDSVYQYLNQAHEQIDSLTSPKIQASYYNLLGNVNIRIGLTKEALNAYLIEASILEHSHSDHALAVVYNNLGNVFRSISDKQKTVEYLKRAVMINKTQKNNNDLAMNYSNLGVFYLESDSIPTAIEFFNQAITLAKKTSSIVLLAQNGLNMGNAYQQLGQYSLATSYYDSVNAICTKYDMPYGLLLTKINLGDLNTLQGNYSLAEELLQEALIDAKKSDLIHEEISIYQMLSKLYKETGSFEKALKFNELYMNSNDSLEKETNSRIVQELINQSEREKRAKEMLILNNQVKSAHLSRKIIVFIALSVILALSLLIWFFVAGKRKARLENALAEKENENLNLINKTIKLDLKNSKIENTLIAEKDNNKQLQLQIKEQELVYQSLKQADLMQFNKTTVEILTPFIYKITRKKDKEDFENALKGIAQNCPHDPLADFENMFIQMHGDFYKKLLAISPELSRSELQMCALLRMNLPSKEIARLLNITNSTVDVTRHRIRQKLMLDSSQHLISSLIMI